MGLSTAPKGTSRNDSGAQRMGNYFCSVGAGVVTDPEGEGEHRTMPLPWGTGQGMSPGVPAGDPFWPRKGHSKGFHFGFKGLGTQRHICSRDQFDSKKRQFYTRKQ